MERNSQFCTPYVSETLKLRVVMVPFTAGHFKLSGKYYWPFSSLYVLNTRLEIHLMVVPCMLMYCSKKLKLLNKQLKCCLLITK
jgi:hypothetical protein